jgi:phage regulator Rha-like protein
MNELTIINYNGRPTIDSRDVAEMVNMRHSDLLEKINGYVQILLNGKFRSVDFFIESAEEWITPLTGRVFIDRAKGGGLFPIHHE